MAAVRAGILFAPLASRAVHQGGTRERLALFTPPVQNEKNTMQLLRISGIIIASALSLSACDGDGLTDPGGLRIGQFEGQIAGTLDGRLDGEAVSGSTVSGFHDVIVLTDDRRGIEITLYHDTDEFFEGRYRIGDAVAMDEPIVAYVRLLDTGEYFDSLDGEIDLHDVHGGGIEGTASFRAESDEVFGEIVDVDVAFSTDYTGNISFSLSPSLSVGAKSSGGGS